MKRITTLFLVLFIAYNLNSQCGGSDPTINAPGWDYGETNEKNYNDARRWEEINLSLTTNCLGDMVEPSIGLSNMSEEAIALYIHNSERVARGELPLYDVETNLDNVAESHSAWQITNGVFDHGGDSALGSAENYKFCSDCNTTETGFTG